MKNKTLKGSIAIGISAVMWGFDGVVLTPRLYNLDVGFVVFILHLIPFLLMNIFMYRQYRFINDFKAKDIIVFKGFRKSIVVANKLVFSEAFKNNNIFCL